MICKTIIFLLLCLTVVTNGQGNACLLDNMPQSGRIEFNVWDYEQGTVYTHAATTSNIQSVSFISTNGSEQYMNAAISGTEFSLYTTDHFARYEENETENVFLLVIELTCSASSSSQQLVIVTVLDTNNNSPVFQPADDNNVHQGYEFTIVPPLGIGFEITGCQNAIIVKDIDLTTYRIDFTLTGSSDFEILFDETSTTEPKHFMAILRTTTIIRSLPEPLELVISATDVDQTGGPQRTTYTTLRLIAEEGVQLPDQPVFEQPFYLATYNRDNTIDLVGSISLQIGYDEEVIFTLDPEYEDYFSLVINENDVTLAVRSPLSEDILTRQQIFLIVRAEREHTSRATTTVVVQLPEEIQIEFERTHYQGTIMDNEMILSDLILTQGYENRNVSVDVTHDFFTASIVENIITLEMQTLTENIIEDNTFLSFEVNAFTDRSSAIAIVTLEIIKNDTVTPVFGEVLYEGAYGSDLSLDIELIQGYDDTVEIALRGEYAHYFTLTRNQEISTLVVSDLTLENIYESRLMLTIVATKPRTVGATAAIAITLPEEISLQFERTYYEGTIEDNILHLSDLLLSQGYDGHTVSATTSHELFTASVTDNRITLSMEPLPADVLEDNSFLNVEVLALTERSAASAVVTLQIVKNDSITPIFGSALYEGTYNVELGLVIEDIELVQGFDETVEVALLGEFAEYFTLTNNEHIFTITVGTLPVDATAAQSVMLTIAASKPRTVGATAVIAIAMPRARELEFDSPSYSGTYQNGELTIDSIQLNNDYNEDINFVITGGEYVSYFEASNSGSQVTVSLLDELPESIVLQNNFLLLTLSAIGTNSNATTAIFIEIIKEDASTPIFNQNVYHGIYSDGEIDISDITLEQGFDDTVSFKLDGDHSRFFTYTEIENGISITLNSVIPEDLIFDEKALIFSVVAEKPLTVGAHATISISFPSELTDLAVMKFARNTYVGSLENGDLKVDDIVLDVGYVAGTEFHLTGEYANYFTHSSENGVVTVSISDTLSPDLVRDNKFIILELEARRERAVSVFSSILIELIQEENTVLIPVFNKAYYRGTYEEELQIEEISLSQGYDETVEFNLAGEFSEYFHITDTYNSIILSGNLTEEVLENNDQLVLTIIASKPDVISGMAAIVVDILKEFHEDEILGFEKTNYLGTIENGSVNLEQIILHEGYTSDVEFTVHGDLSPFFGLSPQNEIVTLHLLDVIPEELIPINRIVILEIQATKTDARPAITTIVLEVILDELPVPTQLAFDRTFYVGSYTVDEDVTLDEAISLSDGYDEYVTFDLEGDDSYYFEIVQNENVVTLRAPNPIPSDVVDDNNQLIFIVNAQRPNTTTTRATVIINLPNESSEDTIHLGFEKTSYVGAIENGTVNLEQIILSEGYSSDVTFTVHGDLSSFFGLSPQDDTVTLQLQGIIPEELIPINRIVILEIQATKTDARPAIATIVLEVILDELPVPTQLAFNRTFYVGSYTVDGGVTLDEAISLSDGYDEYVTFDLEGDDSYYFEIVQNEDVVTLRAPNPIPSDVVDDKNQLIFIVNAQRPNTATTRATVIIHLPNESSEETIHLGFEKTSYVGAIENGTVNLEQIILSEGYSSDVTFTVHGDLSSFFDLSPQDDTVTLHLLDVIPEDLIPINRIVILEIQATKTDARPAIATIVLEVVVDDSPLPTQLAFEETYYVGTYTVDGGVTLDEAISLSDGYDEYVTFGLEGEDAQYFEIVQNENVVTLRAPLPIPNAVVNNNNHLLFIINAQRPNATTTRAAVFIHLPNEFDDDAIDLGFEKTSYVGAIENGNINLEQIILREGYTSDVIFTVHGDLSPFFGLSPQDDTVTLHLLDIIPEDLIPINRIVILEIQATKTDARPAIATIVLEVVVDDSPLPTQLAFEETYYVGTYTVDGAVTLDEAISLSDGYDEYVTFGLEGEDAQYFEIVQNENVVTLRAPLPIPNAVVNNNNHLLFIINAQRPNATTTRAAVFIHLPNEFDDDAIDLGFEKTSYVGAIENGNINLEQIILREGYTSDVIFTVHGDLSPFFGLSPQDDTVTLHLLDIIPEDLIPINRIVILEIQATKTDARPAIATIVLEVVVDDSPLPTQLAFEETYYVGTYTVDGGVTLDEAISLSDGYDEYVTFGLEGEDAQYFEIVQNENVVTLRAPLPIPNAVVNNNNHLLFIINAQRPNATTTRAAVFIHLPNEFDDDAIDLGFEKTSYVGAIENGNIILEQIILREGYTSDVIFTVHGDLSPFFGLSPQDDTVTLHLLDIIPEDLIPINRIVILEIQATKTDARPAIATIVLEVVVDDSPLPTQLAFEETYYVGTYTVDGGVTLDEAISLSDGYDEYVTFGLEGEDAQYFEIVHNENVVTLRAPLPIPNAVVNNNNHLLFIINAQRPNATTTRAAVIIHLLNEFDDDAIDIGFEKTSYVGAIENGNINLEQIILREGYTSDVIFTVHGDLSPFFGLSPQDDTVTLHLLDIIPEDLIPINRIVILEIQATKTDARPAIATIVLEVVVDDSPLPTQLAFEETYYVGMYTVDGGITLDEAISLSDGYDEYVTFGLEGEDAQYFEIVQNENVVTLRAPLPIPNAVVNNNNHLLFIINAQRPNATTTRAAVFIHLPNEFDDDAIDLGFEKTSYVGAIENGNINLEQIILREGYTSDVIFTVHGDLSPFFGLSPQDDTVTLHLLDIIPEDLIPINRIVILEIQATKTDARPAIATIVLEVVVDDSPLPTQLAFEETYYVGTYTVDGGVTLDEAISLSDGYDEYVTFGLEGEDAQYFEIVQNENVVTLRAPLPIPNAVVNNNNHLLFIINAQRPNATTTRAAVFIHLPNEFDDDAIDLGFEKTSYVGAIENGNINLEQIILREGYTSDVIFTVHGDLSPFFGLSPQDDTVTLHLLDIIPEDLIPINRIVILEIQATKTDARPAIATIVLEVVVDDSPLPTQLAFEETYYVGTYTVDGGVTLDEAISLSDGYDEYVTFGLEGEDAQYFEIVQNENVVTLRAPLPIPNAVVNNNNHLLFIINAQRPNATTTRAAVFIHLPNEFDDDAIDIGFEKTSYVGAIENGIINLEQIILREGYTSDVIFTVHGDLSPFFGLSPQDDIVTLHLLDIIPEDLIPINRIVILEIQATKTDARPAIATIVLEVVVDDSPLPTQLAFEETYYVGTYTVDGGVTLDEAISLSDGYDEYVTFGLEGEDAQYFEIVQNENVVTLRAPLPIPNAVVNNNNHLLFIVNAQRPNATTTRAAVIIHLLNEFAEDAIDLGFEKTSYVGAIENGNINLEQIILREGYTSDVIFTVHGDLGPFFGLSPQDDTVTLHLLDIIPEDLIPINRIVILEIQATKTDARPAIATIVLEVVVDDSPLPTQLAFEETYYVGTYTVDGGVTLDEAISLSDGYDEYVTFGLEGEDAQYFEIVQNENVVTLRAPLPIPNAVVNNNNHLLFIVNAQRPNATTTRAAVIIHLPNEFAEDAIDLGFEKTSYVGVIENGNINLEQIILREGYTSDVIFTVHGDLGPFFGLSPQDDTVTLHLLDIIPEDLIPINRIVILEIQATKTDARPAIATIVLEVVVDDSPLPTQLAFEETYYVGTYTVDGGVTLDEAISLSDGYDEYVTFGLEGEDAQYFEIVQNENVVTLRAPLPIPNAVVNNNNHLLFIVNAQRPNATTTRAAVIIHLPNEFAEDAIDLGFEKTSYVGAIENGNINLEQIILREGYTSDVIFTVHGDLGPFFGLSLQDDTVTLHLLDIIPEDLIPINRIVILEIQATKTDARPAIATIVLEVVVDDSPLPTQLAFEETYYVGTYTVDGGVTLDEAISLSDGYDEYVTFGLEGEDAQYFEIVQNENVVTLRAPLPIPNAVVNNNNHLLFIVNAQRPNATTTRAAVIINLPNEFDEDVILLGFEKTSYVGAIENGNINLEQIILREGYTSDVIFTVHGDLSPFFGLSSQDDTVTLLLLNVIPEDLIPINRIVILEIQATKTDAKPAITTIVLEVVLDDLPLPTQLAFEETYYVGTYTVAGGVTLDEAISLSDGYDEYVTFGLDGDNSQYFEIVQNENSVTIRAAYPIPSDVLTDNNQLIFIVNAQRPNMITARAAVIIFLPRDSPNPIVTFDPSAYMLRVELYQTGIIGQVYATASNGETIRYSFDLEDDHLQTRLTVDSDGQLYLSSPANGGEYIFNIIGTTVATQVTASAAVYITVESISVMLPPLIVLDRDEEEAHLNLIVFDNPEYTDCTYSITNKWPVNQNWLYVDSNGLHARAIDREDPSIAFMALSQVQVELVLDCSIGTRAKRSLVSESRMEWLGPYDYGTNTWILADSISYNSTRSFVNLIINDINDNAPVFVGVGAENEPIVVGYPISEIKNLVMTRALAELQATDPDIGENAAILYWTSEPALAVSPSSGSVHVRNDAILEDGQTLTVYATDRNGAGHTGSVNLMVKLLDTTNIAVITVRDAFIEDEPTILANLSSVVGYEVKVLTSVVVSSETDVESNADTVRKTRQTTTETGASLELYIYGMIETEPVTVTQLTEDIDNNHITGIEIVSTATLEQHLDGRLIRISGRNVGLFVATIVLSCVLFILIVAIAVWFFIKWRRDRNYDEFSDESSIESRNSSIVEERKSVAQPAPRINIEELKRSERRLQEMINTVYDEATEPTTSPVQKPVEPIVNIGPADTNTAIVIRDRLKDAESDIPDSDEFGEAPTRRKSVVKFNENVERIIHVEDNEDPDLEVFKF